MLRDDLVRVQHMLDAAREALSFAKNKARRDLDEDRLLSLALLRLVEIIGEAASRVSEEAKNDHLEVPWRSIIAMRNRLIHAYFDIDLDRLWDTLEEDLPRLVRLLQNLLDSEND